MMKFLVVLALVAIAHGRVIKNSLTEQDLKQLEKLLLDRRQMGGSGGGGGGSGGSEMGSGEALGEMEAGAKDAGFGHEALGFLDFMGKNIQPPSEHCVRRLGLPTPPDSSERRAGPVSKDEVMGVLHKVAGKLVELGDKFEGAEGNADKIKELFDKLANGEQVPIEDINNEHVKLFEKVSHLHESSGQDAWCALEVLFPLSFRMNLFHTEGFAENFKCRSTYETLLGLILDHAVPKPGVIDPKELHDLVLPTDTQLRDIVKDNQDFWGRVSHGLRGDVRCLAKMHKDMRDGIQQYKDYPLDNPGDALSVIDYFIYFTFNTNIDRELLMAAMQHIISLAPENGPAQIANKRSLMNESLMKDLNKLMKKNN